jgi:simple sugar transport system ATP-binding protein
VVEPGEIHALLGENGAGKSTLMNVLYGLLQPDEGEIVVNGEPKRFRSPGDAIDAGIGMVHQHFMLVPVFTVTENIMLGAERTRGGLLNRASARERVLAVSSQYGLPVDPDATVEDLPVGVQQRVEIIKALVRNVDLLILDEPTAVLTPQETDELLAVMRSLKADGKSIVFITHKLKEVKAIADRITVVRRGRTVGTATPDASEDSLAAQMVGRTVKLRVDKEPAQPGEPILTVSGLTVLDERGQVAVDAIDLEVRAGEVLGIAGVQGNGQTELIEAIMGLRPVQSGEITLHEGRSGTGRAAGGRRGAVPASQSLVGRRTREILHAGVGYVPEDRSVDGLVMEFSVAENLVLDRYDQSQYASGIALSPTAINEAAKARISEFDVRTPSHLAPVSTLSGGNQQKVIVAREMSSPLKLLIAAQPTRGVDVGSTEFIHARVVRERDQGTGVLLVSSELDEVVALADRIAVMYRGKVLATLPADAPREQIGLLMAGVSDPTAPQTSGSGTSGSDTSRSEAAREEDES